MNRKPFIIFLLVTLISPVNSQAIEGTLSAEKATGQVAPIPGDTESLSENNLLSDIEDEVVFDDEKMITGYREKYKNLSREILLEMIKDETLNPFKTTAAISLFNEKHSTEIISDEKRRIEKIFLRRLNRSDSAFIQVELMEGLLLIDRYKYYKSMIPALLQKLNHYNTVVSKIAYENILSVSTAANMRPREARIVFDTLRKILFLSRRRLAEVEKPDENLSRKLDLLKLSIRILGTEELKKLPNEVINLL